MIGVILAAGRGSRLGQATDDVPKPLLRVGDRACIDFAIESLLPATDRIVVVTGYRAELVEAHLEQRWAGHPVAAVRNALPEAGNLTSLAAARGALGRAPFILTNADHLFPDTMYTQFFPPGSGLQIACERGRTVLDDEMKVRLMAGRLADISKTLIDFEGAYIGSTAVGDRMVDAYWQALDAVLASADLRTASVEMVLARLARDPKTAPQVCWIEGLRWFEVDTAEDLALARGSMCV